MSKFQWLQVFLYLTPNHPSTHIALRSVGPYPAIVISGNRQMTPEICIHCVICCCFTQHPLIFQVGSGCPHSASATSKLLKVLPYWLLGASVLGWVPPTWKSSISELSLPFNTSVQKGDCWYQRTIQKCTVLSAS